MQLKSAAPGEKLPESSTFYLPLTYYSESDDDPAPLRVIAAEASGAHNAHFHIGICFFYGILK